MAVPHTCPTHIMPWPPCQPASTHAPPTMMPHPRRLPRGMPVCPRRSPHQHSWRVWPADVPACLHRPLLLTQPAPALPASLGLSTRCGHSGAALGRVQAPPAGAAGSQAGQVTATPLWDVGLVSAGQSHVCLGRGKHEGSSSWRVRAMAEPSRRCCCGLATQHMSCLACWLLLPICTYMRLSRLDTHVCVVYAQAFACGRTAGSIQWEKGAGAPLKKGRQYIGRKGQGHL